VVKPVHEGSSVGVSIVREEGDVWLAFEKATKYGPRAIVEKYIKGKEVHIGILNGNVLGGVEVRPSSRSATTPVTPSSATPSSAA
ncbi:MAG: hypothetical protein R3308_02595, partial [Thiohalobacterales bacterium]|nr:hypothetical protein [Thiohalobacterales bacterium]